MTYSEQTQSDISGFIETLDQRIYELTDDTTDVPLDDRKAGCETEVSALAALRAQAAKLLP